MSGCYMHRPETNRACYACRVADREEEYRTSGEIAPSDRVPYMKGAAAAFGIVGMAEAIRRTHVCVGCDHYPCRCPSETECFAILQRAGVL